MSSRVLTGEQARRALPMRWDVAPGSVQPSGASSQAPAAPSAETTLERRLAELEAEAASREAQARRMGFEEGQAAARRSLEGLFHEAMERMARSLAELTGLRQRLRQQAEEDLVRLATAIARRILRRELSTDPEAILGLVKAAFDRIEGREILRVRLHPEDARLVERRLGDLGTPERVELVADRSLERGALLIETERGELDASVETQLDEIERGLADLIRRQP